MLSEVKTAEILIKKNIRLKQTMDFKHPAYFFTRKPYRLYLPGLQVLLIFLLFAGLSACSGTAGLPEGKRLYTGAVVKVESEKPIPKRAERKLVPQLEAV